MQDFVHQPYSSNCSITCRETKFLGPIGPLDETVGKRLESFGAKVVLSIAVLYNVVHVCKLYMRNRNN